jgi:hypothetical protein
MFKSNIVIGLLALALFAGAQYQGWNLFDRDASQTSRLSGNSSRAYHK